MIVADTNIISYLFLPTVYSGKASSFIKKMPIGLRLVFGVASFVMCLRFI